MRTHPLSLRPELISDFIVVIRSQCQNIEVTIVLVEQTNIAVPVVGHHGSTIEYSLYSSTYLGLIDLIVLMAELQKICCE